MNLHLLKWFDTAEKRQGKHQVFLAVSCFLRIRFVSQRLFRWMTKSSNGTDADLVLLFIQIFFYNGFHLIKFVFNISNQLKLSVRSIKVMSNFVYLKICVTV